MIERQVERKIVDNVIEQEVKEARLRKNLSFEEYMSSGNNPDSAAAASHPTQTTKVEADAEEIEKNRKE